MIIDCHVHLNNYYENTVETLDACLDKLELEMRRNRIDQALVLTSYTVTPGRPSTRTVVEAIRDKPYLTVIAGLDYTRFHPDELVEIGDFVQGGQGPGAQALSRATSRSIRSTPSGHRPTSSRRSTRSRS